MEQLGSVKVENAVKVKFDKVEQDENGNERVIKIEHSFKGEIMVFQNASEEEIKDEFRNFVARVNGEIENWTKAGSGWGYVGTDSAYVNVARYDLLVAGTYIPLPAKLQSKKAIINVQNKNDNECLKWSLRAALFPTQKNTHRTTSYPTNDGINYEGIDFPTPIKQIDKLKAQNENLAINVFG